ncbi:hypothetical protein [Polaribacter marinivivus]|uniref:hypothetical protein n=1 Tax=Polaribacter marinivivus TaxID=1524260 RepID=UPI003D81A999
MNCFVILKGLLFKEIFAPPKGNNFNPVALIIISASKNLPEDSFIPFSTKVSMVSVITFAFPFFMALKKSPSGTKQKR